MPKDSLELSDWLKLTSLPGVGAVLFQRILDVYGSPTQFIQAGAPAWQHFDLKPEALRSLEHHAAEEPATARALEWAEQEHHHILTCQDAHYPQQLLAAGHAPPILYVVGDPTILNWPMLAIIGTRNPSAGGKDTANQFAAQLARSGLVINSGLARGIDACAHSAALQAGGLTVAVTATGADIIYPREHQKLAQQIITEGAVITEMPLGTEVKPTLFPRRNRIIAGMSLGTLVIEAAARSGSLITARLASEQGREVFAIPGSIHNPLSKGCHKLIREGAKLVETADDILEELVGAGLNIPDSQPLPASNLKETPAQDPEHRRVLDALGYDPSSIDALVRRTGLTVATVSSILLIMELRGQVASLSGGMYARTRSEN
ncbi:DNA protecting protein DprA [Ectothiorhodosinus mongolicus]|uniref:DNA protecting protein DprA n=1 Tax=Ectothiorhodosinus mongolicus TaxID=233100 RepID=A0A1R3VX85_9GAMM|nr:DNA-processing protein DprA [Ectothiorhodosinus mongolicus]ULX57948.1 DNA-protecting protein DprA [Ectothiorhodosinus mongolicus]SIT69747.1 DNA protecting protein DprA [Ectothiorhodosinus mongolicus]